MSEQNAKETATGASPNTQHPYLRLRQVCLSPLHSNLPCKPCDRY